MNVQPISPISIVKLLANIPFDSTYSDIMTFNNVTEQQAYFNSKTSLIFENLTPIRMQNTIRVPVFADRVYNCNYIMWQNGNFGFKWFYGFIKKVNFINSNMCEIEFEMDVYQTWMFDMTLHEMYVDREMPLTDNFGENLIVEDIDFGPYVDETAQNTGMMSSYTAVVATAYDSSTEVGGYVGGLFTGLKYIGALVDDAAEVQMLIDFLQAAIEANKVDAITSLFMMPTEFYTSGTSPKSKRFDARMNRTKIGNYTPRCKKVLAYPYNFLYVYTTDGANAIYRYEYFQSASSCGFVLNCAMSCDPEITLQPIAYNKQQFNYDEMLSMGGFPQCSFSIDAYKAWLAQTSSSTALTVIASGATAVGGAMTGNIAAVAGGAFGLASSLNTLVLNMAKPPVIRGTQGNSTMVGTREKDFYFTNKHITEEYAKVIDDYFWMYGYRTCQTKIPEINSRPYWNYVKVKNAKITGNIPFDDINKIKSIFENGVTFWHTQDVGNYTRANFPK